MTPIVLTIAGSDCSSGAGIQADLKTFTTHQVHGLTALTCVVAETPRTVASIHEIPSISLQEQLHALLSAYPIQAIKTGMLHSKAHIIAIAEILEQTNIPLVVDPVMISSSGSPLISDTAIKAYKERLLPITHLITPNMPEASVLLGRDITKEQDLERAAQDIAETFHLSCLLKGGHLAGDGDRIDTLWHDGKVTRFRHPMIDIPCTHGTGCTLSAAITANLATGLDLTKSCAKSIQWLQNVITTSHRWPANDKGEIFCLNHWQPDDNDEHNPTKTPL